MILAIEATHKLGFIHRDIKPVRDVGTRCSQGTTYACIISGQLLVF